MISGINGTNLVMESTVKLRIGKGMIDRASIVEGENGYIVQFHGASAEWNDEPLVLCSVLSTARNPYEPRQFKSLDGAISQVKKIGLESIEITAKVPGT